LLYRSDAVLSKPAITPLLLAIVLAMLAFSASAQAAGASAVAWGDNPYGETGNGVPSEGGCTCVPVPTPVPGLSDATQISGGTAHTIALHANGTVTSWGYNGHGQLGDGTTTESSTPVSLGLTNVVEVDSGYEHNLALLANGTVMAWGDNYSGELGVGGSDFAGGGPEICGTEQCSKVPVQVPGLSDVVAISAGYYFSLALLANGTVMGWGYDFHGQLGGGVGIASGCECVEHPVQIPGVSGAVAISTGEGDAMALLGSGAVVAWGENTNGQIGNGSFTEVSPPACSCVGPVAVNGLPGPARSIAAGSYHNLALVGGGTARTWGYNADGELGNGSENPSGCFCVPTAAAVLSLSGIQSLAAGNYHSLALLGDGSVQSWGKNEHAALGDGSKTARSIPGPVSGLSGVSAVSSSDFTSFALTGPSRTLTVSLAGAGAGTVGGSGGIVCPDANCVGHFPDSQVQMLRAEPAPGTGFAGFTGACTGTGTCQVTMDGEKTVTATFGPPKGTRITKAEITQAREPKKTAHASAGKKPAAKAKFSFSAPGAVTGYQCLLVKPKPKKKARPSKKKAKPKFTKCASPKRYKRLRKGRYTFKVRAQNSLGVDAKPAQRKFRIKR
jgi:alpha-tubulin suppressor-like RCC1 family protein